MIHVSPSQRMIECIVREEKGMMSVDDLIKSFIRKGSFFSLRDPHPAPEIIHSSFQINSYEQLWSCLDSVERLSIGSHSCNDTSITVLKINTLPSLKELVVGDYCFENLFLIHLCNLQYLERFVVGEHSFTHFHDLAFIQQNSHLCDSKLYITQCPSLKEIETGPFSFADHEILIIKGMCFPVIMSRCPTIGVSSIRKDWSGFCIILLLNCPF